MVIDTFIKSLEIMGMGMVAIFVFMLLFWLIIIGLQKIFPPKED